MRSRLLLWALVLMIAIGCQSKAPPEEPEPEIVTPMPVQTLPPPPTPTPTPTPTPEPEPEARNPWTNLPMDPAFEGRRPIAVMLNNLKAALPMCGVAKADILYEALAEGGITRLVGVYQNLSDIPQLGTVRSTRAYYLDIAASHDAIHLHAGYSPEAQSLIAKRKQAALNALMGFADVFTWRDPERRRTAGLEHSLFVDGAKFEEYLQSSKLRLEMDEDWPEPPAHGQPVMTNPTSAKTLSIRFSSYKTGTFAYEDGQYTVSQYGQPLIDGFTEEQLTVKNILILKAKVSTIRGDSAGRLATELVADGDGLYIVDGQCVPIHWSKSAYDQPFVYTLADGSPLILETGNLYVNIVPLDAKIEME